jgi:hypothetical protein
MTPVTTSSNKLRMKPKRIPLVLWQSHLPSPAVPAVPAVAAVPGHPKPHRFLPDGSPLSWTAGKADIFEDLTGEYVPRTFHDASVFLWLASRENDWIQDLWIPGSPVEPQVEGEAEVSARVRFPGLLKLALQWRDAVIPPAAREFATALAARLVLAEYSGSLEIDEAAIEEQSEEVQKKTGAGAGLTGSSPLLSGSPAATPPDSALFFTIPVSPSSLPSTPPGSTPPASLSSPPPPGSEETPSSPT